MAPTKRKRRDVTSLSARSNKRQKPLCVRDALTTAALHLGRVQPEDAIVTQQVGYLRSLLRISVIERCASAREMCEGMCRESDCGPDTIDPAAGVDERHIKRAVRFVKEIAEYMKIFRDDAEVQVAALKALTKLATDNDGGGGGDVAAASVSRRVVRGSRDCTATDLLRICIGNCCLTSTMEALELHGPVVRPVVPKLLTLLQTRGDGTWNTEMVNRLSLSGLMQILQGLTVQQRGNTNNNDNNNGNEGEGEEEASSLDDFLEDTRTGFRIVRMVLRHKHVPPALDLRELEVRLERLEGRLQRAFEGRGRRPEAVDD